MNRSEDLERHDTVQFSQVEKLAGQVAQAWEAQKDSAKGVDLALFLPAAGDPLRVLSLHELIKADLACRWERGLPTSLEDYLEKFPELGASDELPPRIIFEEFRIRTQHGVPTPLNQAILALVKGVERSWA